ncbi:MAG: helix-turn-helix domain-containing protein [Clostridia bacterium]|nr:helix-turn-helix domain-containing protein [Clostridia bacterium]
MATVKRKFIDWEKTAKNLKLLRQDNINLRRFVCGELNRDKGNCAGVCEACRFEMDHSISQLEISKVFNVSESMIVNWENNKSRPQLDDLIFYSQICGIDLYDVIIFAD